MDKNQEHPGLLKRTVTFKFKESVPEEQRTEAAVRFSKLPDTIPEIAHFEWGTDVSIDGLSGGFTHIFSLVFKSAKDRNTYVYHKDHEAFKQFVIPLLEGVNVVDYWTKL
mmetsp:Transcript_3827/g.5342  ORF Transcript_3827/g.5342 Transcript_3827/m.5342 type:complete len:110 (+) Transcript_3827:100-429(+)|eukprot:CAMPEP_0168551752 /NCGR_PEP_ID=MMETSP0413-20121227/6345_1 /TAXON_ID=136452 /ORGANISM="Filamoeba nolandi, Strain NC-AS-23-1" /LENGTH=109 /DNA_ID=CAMNT_0008582309 /DNA_START=35 /DNA_END=364 /DNA_ORIENTATION=+